MRKWRRKKADGPPSWMSMPKGPAVPGRPDLVPELGETWPEFLYRISFIPEPKQPTLIDLWGKTLRRL